jgi:hypothetical protein
MPLLVQINSRGSRGRGALGLHTEVPLDACPTRSRREPTSRPQDGSRVAVSEWETNCETHGSRWGRWAVRSSAVAIVGSGSSRRTGPGRGRRRVVGASSNLRVFRAFAPIPPASQQAVVSTGPRPAHRSPGTDWGARRAYPAVRLRVDSTGPSRRDRICGAFLRTSAGSSSRDEWPAKRKEEGRQAGRTMSPGALALVVIGRQPSRPLSAALYPLYPPIRLTGPVVSRPITPCVTPLAAYPADPPLKTCLKIDIGSHLGNRGVYMIANPSPRVP